MPIGCEFSCENQTCSNFMTGFNMTAPWGIGDIDKIIETKNNKKNSTDKEDLKKQLEEHIEWLKKCVEDNIKYACIDYPNIDEIEIKGYRVNKYCSKCKRIYNWHIIDKPLETVEIDTPALCEVCQNPLISFDDALNFGIECPVCHELLKEKRWFTQNAN